jgi:hypothetical protein
MQTITLSIEEIQALSDVLECSVIELRSQIVHTDRYSYKQMLKNRKELLQNILASLKAPSASA